MPIELSSQAVWREVRRNMFAVIAFTNAKGEPRTAGVVYVVHGGAVWIATLRSSWKARHLGARPAVSTTVVIPKSIPFAPWIRIPAATATFQGTCRVVWPQETPAVVQEALLRGLVENPDLLKDMAFLRIEPQGRFVTYGVGVSLWTMRDTEKARGTAPVK